LPARDRVVDSDEGLAGPQPPWDRIYQFREIPCAAVDLAGSLVDEAVDSRQFLQHIQPRMLGFAAIQFFHHAADLPRSTPASN
jgi:hypothetical protein